MQSYSEQLRSQLEEHRIMLVLAKVRRAESIKQHDAVKELRDFVLESPIVSDNQKALLLEQEKEWKASIDDLVELISKIEARIAELEEDRKTIEELEDILGVQQ